MTKQTQVTQSQNNGRGWEVVQLSNLESEIRMWGEVVGKRPVHWWTGEPLEGEYIVTSEFLEDLEPLKNSRKITIKLNSVGGSVFEAIAIVNTLKGLKAKITVIVEGVAYSSGFTIANAADVLKVYPGSSLMMHRASTFVCDWVNSADVDDILKVLDASENSALEIISAKTGKSIEDLRPLMNDTTFMTGREAVEQGFADELIEDDGPSLTYSPSNKLMAVGNHIFNVTNSGVPLDYLNTLPRAKLNIEAQSNDAKNKADKAEGKSDKTSENIENERNEQEMTQETKNQEQIDSAVENALQGERARTKAIREIANMIDDETLVTSALEDPQMTAEKLALQAFQNQAKLKSNAEQNEASQRKKHLDGIRNDAKNSGAEQLESAPNSGTQETEEEPTAKELASQVLAKYKQYNGGK